MKTIVSTVFVEMPDGEIRTVNGLGTSWRWARGKQAIQEYFFDSGEVGVVVSEAEARVRKVEYDENQERLRLQAESDARGVDALEKYIFKNNDIEDNRTPEEILADVLDSGDSRS